MKTKLAFLLAIGLFVGCGKENPDDNLPPSGPGTTYEQPSYTTLGQGTHSNYTVANRAHYVVRDQVAWQFLYKWVTGDTMPAPLVDFSGGDVAAAAIYRFNTGGYSIEFSDVTVDLPNATWANVRENHPAPGSNLIMMITYPFALASFASDASQPVKFTRSVLVDGDPNEMMYKMLMIGTDREFGEMSKEEIQLRLQYQPTLPEMDQGDLASLLAMTCPDDQATLSEFELKLATTQANDPEYIYFCPEHGEYWLLDTDATYWMGPFTPGKFY